MDLKDTDIQVFIDAYREDYGEELSLNEAQALLTQLIELYSILVQPAPTETTDSDSATRGKTEEDQDQAA